MSEGDPGIKQKKSRLSPKNLQEGVIQMAMNMSKAARFLLWTGNNKRHLVGKECTFEAGAQIGRKPIDLGKYRLKNWRKILKNQRQTQNSLGLVLVLGLGFSRDAFKHSFSRDDFKHSSVF